MSKIRRSLNIVAKTKTDVALLVKEARHNAGLSQALLAKKMKTASVYISYIESGKRTPSIEKLEQLAEAVDCSLRIEFVPNWLRRETQHVNNKISNSKVEPRGS